MKRQQVLGTIVALVVWAGLAGAATPVPNGSFEADVVTFGNRLETIPTSWMQTFGTAFPAVYRPGAGDPLHGQIPDGDQALILPSSVAVSTVDSGIYLQEGTGIRLMLDASYLEDVVGPGLQVNSTGPVSNIQYFQPTAGSAGFDTFEYLYFPSAAENGMPFNFQVYCRSASDNLVIDNIRYETMDAPIMPPKPGPVTGTDVIPGGTAPYAWYRADMGITGFQNDDSGAVAWWQDQSGNSRHISAPSYFIAPTATDNGVGGLPALTFDGLGDQLHGTPEDWGLKDPGTVFAVWHMDGDVSAAIHYLYDAGATAIPLEREFFSTRNPALGQWDIGGRDDPATNYTNGQLVYDTRDRWIISSVSHTTGATDTIRFNGEEIYNGNLLSGGLEGLRVGRFSVGERHYWDGEICELIFYDGELSETERIAIEEALIDRWDLRGTFLPEKPERPGEVSGGPVIPDGTTPYAWYRADRGVTTYPAGNYGEAVAWWQDQSGNARHVTSKDAASAPIVNTENGASGLPVLTFDGMNDGLHGSVEEWGEALPGTVFVVYRQDESATGDQFVYDAGQPGDRQFFLITQGAEQDTLNAGGAFFTPPNTYETHNNTTTVLPEQGSWVVGSVSHATGATDTIRINGEEFFSGDLASGGMDGLWLGRYLISASYMFKGDIAEFVYFEGDLSAQERADIETALMTRWGLIAGPDLPGDLNGDGMVGSADLDIVRANWGATVDAGCLPCGDPSGDGIVGSADLDIVRANWGATASAAVPEPASAALLLALVLAGCGARRRPSR